MVPTTETALHSYDITSLTSKKMAWMVLSHAHEHSWKLFMLYGLGKGPGTWTRMPQLLENRPGHQDICYSEVPSALCLTARHHKLSEPKALLRKGFRVINVSTKSCDFDEFVLSDEKKCIAARFPKEL